MKRRILLSLGLAVGLTLLVLAALTGQPTQATAVCNRYVVNSFGIDTGSCTSGSPCRTVQYALSRAATGETICVADNTTVAGPSVYTGTVVITKSVTLDGAWNAACIAGCTFTPNGCSAGSVVLDAQGAGRVISITGSITPTVKCFTITGGNAGKTASPDKGGGIYSQNAAPVIVGNVITGNYGCTTFSCTTGNGKGGGIYLLNAPGTSIISSNLVVNNVADDGSWGQGGGIYVEGSYAQVVSNTIQTNRAGLSAGDGGGIMVRDGGPTIADNQVLTNVAGMAVMCNGGGIYVRSSTPVTIERNLLQANRALNGTGSAGLTSRGGGIYYAGDPSASAFIRDNRVLANTAATAGVGEGGGMYLRGLATGSTVSGNSVSSNIAGFNQDGSGGGIYVDGSSATIQDNDLLGNAATWAGSLGQGGGLYVNGGAVLIQGGEISNNFAAAFPGAPAHAAGYGGGVAISGSQAIVQDTWIAGNQGTNSDNAGVGGGIYGYSSTLNVVSNHILSNTTGPGASGLGGGVYLESSRAFVDGNTILSNRAAGSLWGRGGGVRINSCPAFTLTNNIVARNAVSTTGSGVAVAVSTGRLDYNTIADNTNGDGVGVRADSSSNVTLTNNIVANQTVGISTTTSSSVNAQYTLFDGNGQNYKGSVTSANEIPGPAALQADYHLRNWSAAIDRATPLAWVTTDVDGDPRPFGLGYDVGADEASCSRFVLNTDGDDTSNDCSDPAYPCRTVQRALGQAAEGDIICVAHNPLQPGPSVYTGTNTIDKSVRLDGAWEAACVDPHNLTCGFTAVSCNPANVVLDAQGAGRVMTVTGASGWITPTVRCLTLTGGRTTADPNGGGLYSRDATLVVAQTVITNNVSTSFGGGIEIESGSAVITANQVLSNYTTYGGGGIDLSMDTVIWLHGNTIADNRTSVSGYGGAINMDRAILTATANLILNNQSPSAWMLSGSTDRRVMAVNNVVANNDGVGLLVYSYQVDLIHNTVVSNTDHAVGGYYTATMTLTNNIIAYNKYESIMTGSGASAIASYNLFWGNGSDPITGTHAVLGNPMLAADGYHLGPGSAAVNRGVATWVTTDIDGDPRSGAPDLGADEYIQRVYLPVVMRNW